MANTSDKVIKIALGEVGYLEKKDGNLTYLFDKTANAGDKNYTKYGYEMHSIYPAIMDYPAYWCDAFVDWCFYKAYGISTAKSLLGGNFDDYTVASASKYKAKNALDSIPRVGDQVFFTRNGQVSGCHHTGIVYLVNDKFFYTVEGNTSGGSGIVRNGGGVAKKKYAIAQYKGKVLFGHPKYEANEPKPVAEKTVTANKLNVRKGPGKEYDVVRIIFKGSKVKVLGIQNDWTRIGDSEWVSNSFIE